MVFYGRLYCNFEEHLLRQEYLIRRTFFLMGQDSVEGNQVFLEKEIIRIGNAIKHLIRSNDELQEALKADNDPLYREALQENQVVIQSMKDKLAVIERELGGARCR